MDSFQAALDKLSKDPAVFSRLRSELQVAEDPRARFVELAREQGIEVDTNELDRVVQSARQELNERELESVSGGVAPGPPERYIKGESQQILIGLLLPAVQKVRDVT